VQVEVQVVDAELQPAVSGERFDTQGAAGRIAFYVAGSGPPLLLVHSVNAAASAAEVRPLHEHYRASRTVYSIDLPGFGASERSDRVYSPRLMTDALLQLLDAIAARGQTLWPYPPAASFWRERRRSFRSGSAPSPS
jgi:pimeloyl-ACP methyl ester carboxylesterase